MKKYEVPFNFDVNLLNFLDEHISKEWIEFLFFSPFKEDSKNARSHVENVKKEWGMYKVPETRKDYSDFVYEIHKRGYKMAVLLQDKNPIPLKTLKYYIDLGIQNFIVNSDELAFTIKNINPNLKVIASITKTLSAKDLWEKDHFIYDKIVLHFPFNRALCRLKELPKHYKYTILVNSYCTYNCTQAKNHWNSNVETSKYIQCTKNQQKDDLIYIPPEYVHLFEPYIDSFKIQGREYPTSIIANEIYCYYNKLHNPLAGAIYNRLNPFNCKDYFSKGKDYEFVIYNNPNPNGFSPIGRPA